MIYDCFTFFNELDLLELRLNILNDTVDKFVIVEGTKTFTGKDKPMNFKENKQRFSKFLDKIIYIEFDNFPPNENPWAYESLQRNAIELGLKDCKDDDIIIISDLDEIVSPEAVKEGIKNINTGTPIKKFVQYNFSYYLNAIKAQEPLWFHPEMCTYKNFKNCLDNVEYNYNTFVQEKFNPGTCANKIRMYEEADLIPFGGWHFSFLGNAEKILYKYQNFSHQEFMQDIDSIMQNIASNIKNINSTNDSNEFRAMKHSILPEYVQNNIEKYKSFITETDDDKLCSFDEIFDGKEIKSKFLKYSLLRFFTIGKARKRYKRKYNSFKERYRIIKKYY